MPFFEVSTDYSKAPMSTVTLFPPRLLFEGMESWRTKLSQFTDLPVMVWLGGEHRCGSSRNQWFPQVGSLISVVSMEVTGADAVVAQLCISDAILDGLCRAIVPEANGNSEDRLAFGAPVALETGNILLNALFAVIGRRQNGVYSFSIPKYARCRFEKLDTASSLLVSALIQVGTDKPGWIGLRLAAIQTQEKLAT